MAVAEFEELSATFGFRVEAWDTSRDHPYRIGYLLRTGMDSTVPCFFEGTVRRPEARTEIPSYTPPYDKSHPQSGEMPKGTKPHDLNRLMAARLIQSMGHGRFTDQDLHRTAVSISEGAETMEELHTLLSDFMKKVA